MVETLLKSGQFVGYSIDGWKGVNKILVDGVTLRIARSVFPVECWLGGWVELLFGLEYGSWCYFCSDDTGNCGKARHILALRHPDIILNKCWAHQINLMVKPFLETVLFKEVLKLALAVANALTTLSSKWLVKLKDVIKMTYGKIHKATSIMGIVETRRNSIQACFASQLRTRRALQMFVIKFHDNSTFPAALSVLNNRHYFT